MPSSELVTTDSRKRKRVCLSPEEDILPHKRGKTGDTHPLPSFPACADVPHDTVKVVPTVQARADPTPSSKRSKRKLDDDDTDAEDVPSQKRPKRRHIIIPDEADKNEPRPRVPRVRRSSSKLLNGRVSRPKSFVVAAAAAAPGSSAVAVPAASASVSADTDAVQESPNQPVVPHTNVDAVQTAPSQLPQHANANAHTVQQAPTSHAYIIRTLTNSGEEVIVPRPGYRWCANDGWYVTHCMRTPSSPLAPNYKRRPHVPTAPEVFYGKDKVPWDRRNYRRDLLQYRFKLLRKRKHKRPLKPPSWLRNPNPQKPPQRPPTPTLRADPSTPTRQCPPCHKPGSPAVCISPRPIRPEARLPSTPPAWLLTPEAPTIEEKSSPAPSDDVENYLAPQAGPSTLTAQHTGSPADCISPRPIRPEARLPSTPPAWLLTPEAPTIEEEPGPAPSDDVEDYPASQASPSTPTAQHPPCHEPGSHVDCISPRPIRPEARLPTPPAWFLTPEAPLLSWSEDPTIEESSLAPSEDVEDHPAWLDPSLRMEPQPQVPPEEGGPLDTVPLGKFIDELVAEATGQQRSDMRVDTHPRLEAPMLWPSSSSLDSNPQEWLTTTGPADSGMDIDDDDLGGYYSEDIACDLVFEPPPMAMAPSAFTVTLPPSCIYKESSLYAMVNRWTWAGSTASTTPSSSSDEEG